MEYEKQEIKQFIKEVYKIIEENKNEADSYKIREIEKEVERRVQS